MRGTCIQTLLEIADKDERVVLLTGDLGYTVLEPFAERHPGRFFNAGVAEQNMIGLATGLAEAGFYPFVYSIVTFATLRGYEVIRNGPVLHRLPVRIFGVGGGMEYGSAGFTHHGLEDVGVMRLQPGMTIIAPADARQARAALLATWELPGPVYYRLGKNETVAVPGLEGEFALGRVQVIREGSGALLLSMGAISAEVAGAAELLEQRGVDVTHAVVATLQPPPTEELLRLLARFAVVVCVEAHYVSGGLGSLKIFTFSAIM